MHEGEVWCRWEGDKSGKQEERREGEGECILRQCAKLFAGSAHLGTRLQPQQEERKIGVEPPSFPWIFNSADVRTAEAAGLAVCEQGAASPLSLAYYA